MTKMVLPSLRVDVARSLVNDYGLKPINVAKMMDVSPAAVTQYLKGVRGRGFDETIFRNGRIKREVDDVVREIVKNPRDHSQVLRKLCRLCRVIRQEALICDECKKLSPALQDLDCTLCR